MATTVTHNKRNDGYVTWAWNLAQDETGDTITVGHVAGVKTVQITGTYGGGTVAVQGSLDGVTWFPVHVANFTAGDYETLTAVGANRIDAIIENPLFVRVVITGGDGTTAIKVVVSANSRL